MNCGDTIAAVATAPGRGGVAVVRVSGPDAFAIAEGLTGRKADPGKNALRKIRSASSGSVVDEAVVLAFRGPRSYTGEDVVEFQCHGGAVTPRRVLEACFAAGARPARRGEFTERAFLNGRLDYGQAESVLDLVDAKTERAADAALEGLSGGRRREARELYELALGLSAELEHALDVDEEDLRPSFFDDVRSRTETLAARLRSAVRRAKEGRILRDGALVVLAGPPNAGKSSLLNALLDENRAIVSDMPGTTRDSIEAWLDICGWPVRIVDTAGLRQTRDAVEAEGVRRAEELAARADIVLALDCSPSAAGDRVLRLHAKCDLGRGEGLNVSSKTGEGLDELRLAIAKRLDAKSSEPADASDAAPGEEAVATYVGALSLLEEMLGDGTSAHDPVLAANATRQAAGLLGALVGATYSSDMLDRLFSRFCVGK